MVQLIKLTTLDAYNRPREVFFNTDHILRFYPISPAGSRIVQAVEDEAVDVQEEAWQIVELLGGHT